MASFPQPSTPKTSPAPDNQTPGKWRHPRLNEIVKRQNAAIFGYGNIERLFWNGAALFTTWIFGKELKSYTYRLASMAQLSKYSDLCLLLLRLFFLINIIAALYPLFRPKDSFSDIPLTPSQRALLGLDPTNIPLALSGTQYVTPPRYRLSASRTASPGSRNTTPLSLNESPSWHAASFSPSPSPRFQKAVANGSREAGRKQSIGSGSLNWSFKDSNGAWSPASPSPVGSKGSGPGLSNRWLYEHSRRHSAGNKFF